MKDDPSRRPPELPPPSDAWSDLVLTLPFFIGYHLGILYLPIRNAADLVTRELVALAGHDRMAYAGLTLGIGLSYVTLLGLAGRGHALRWQRFAGIALEGTLYAIAMRFVASYVVGKVTLGAEGIGPFAGLVMSFGAGFYEEVVFRVGLFGLGLRALRLLVPPETATGRALLAPAWAIATALLFSAWHYIGALGDPFELRSFVFRWVCGVVFVIIYAFRGFAPVVWTHALYDVWVLVL